MALEKLRRLRASVGPDVLLSVDGGVNLDTVGLCRGRRRLVCHGHGHFFRRRLRPVLA